MSSRPYIRTAACIVEHDKKLLVLLRNDNKSEGGRWGLPAGKVDPGESDAETAVRELHEETGIHVATTDLIDYGVHIFDYTDLHLELATFFIKIEQPQSVKIRNTEHQGFSWMSAHEICNTHNIVTDLDRLLKNVGLVS